MKSEIPNRTTNAPIAIAIAPVPLNPLSVADVVVGRIVVGVVLV